MTKSETFCDLCNAPILEGMYSTTARVPIPKSVRDEVVKSLEKNYQTMTARPSVLGLVVPPELSVPRVWEFSICIGCTTGLLPVTKIVETIRRYIQESMDAKRRALESMEDLESAAR